jgi:hypothetical protein
MWITNSGEAEIFLVFANIGMTMDRITIEKVPSCWENYSNSVCVVLFFSDPSAGYKGITCFVVEKDWGVSIAKKETKVRKDLANIGYTLDCICSNLILCLIARDSSLVNLHSKF